MKNKKIFICISLIIVLIFSIIYKYQNSNKNEMKNNTSELISFYIETENNEYEKTKDLNFPTEGYVLNEAKSNCENNSELSWINNKIQLIGNKSDRCYIYFDNIVKDYDYTGTYQEFIAPANGTYKIEVWGASGGDIAAYKGGKGAYTKGKIYLSKGEKLYIYVGGQGSNTDIGGYNGGGNLLSGQRAYGSSGGGATDIRLTNGEWDSFESLKSRIMVAAGGGASMPGNMAYGGTLTGGVHPVTSIYMSTPATQTKAGIGKHGCENIKAKFGIGGNCAGGGGGYFGGAGSAYGYGGGSGGSSYISGYKGCVAIKQESTEDNIQQKENCTDGTEDVECSYHYSGKIFTETQMLAGNETMPSPEGKTEEGHSGNGYARITYLGK